MGIDYFHVQEKVTRKLLTFMYQVYKSELPDNIIRLFSSTNCQGSLWNPMRKWSTTFKKHMIKLRNNNNDNNNNNKGLY